MIKFCNDWEEEEGFLLVKDSPKHAIAFLLVGFGAPRVFFRTQNNYLCVANVESHTRPLLFACDSLSDLIIEFVRFPPITLHFRVQLE